MILGITGSFGSGKSTVTALFAAAGWQVFDADAFCRDLYDNPPPDFRAELERKWDAGIVSRTGGVDRAAVSRRVFRNPDELAWLTGLIYPRLETAMAGRIDAVRRSGGNGAFEVPLLFECGWENRFDGVVAVWAPDEVRRRRLSDFRNFDQAEIGRREARQLAPAVKLERADFALINRGGPEELRNQFRELLSQF